MQQLSSAAAVVLIGMAETPYDKWLQRCSPDSAGQVYAHACQAVTWSACGRQLLPAAGPKGAVLVCGGPICQVYLRLVALAPRTTALSCRQLSQLRFDCL
jgi:hypothetical protein